jgi:hypothetical protein
VAAALTGTDAPGGGARNGRALDGDGSPDRRGRAGGWVDRDRGLYRRCGSEKLSGQFLGLIMMSH